MVSVRTMSMSMEYSAVLSSEELEMPIETKTDPPKTVKEWFSSLFGWQTNSSKEADSNNEVRKTFIREGEKTIEMGNAYHSTILTLMTLPIGGEGGALLSLESKGAVTVVKESATKYSVIAELGSASAFYKVLNPNWNGVYQYTKGAFSTTSFTTATGTKVVLNTTSMSTGQASVKIIEKGMQILFRFPNL